MNKLITFTREELYELVWQKPVMRIAQEYAITDKGLAKICKRHRIPTPPRGYWAKLQAGNPPQRPTLPAWRGGGPIQLREVSAAGDGDGKAGRLATSIERERTEESRILVAKQLRSPCEPVRLAKERMALVEPDMHGLLRAPQGTLDVRASRACLPRALRIADALFKSFADRGWEPEVRGAGIEVNLGGALIEVSISEDLETVALPPKQDLSGYYSFHYSRQETERRPSGRLSIAIKEEHSLYHHNQRRRWRDSDKSALEEQLNKVVVGMLKLASAVHADQEDKARRAALEAERRRQWESEEEARRRAKEAIAEERARVERLLDQAERWRRCRDLRLFIEAATAHESLPEQGLEGAELAEWVEWASRQADRLDPLAKNPESILNDERDEAPRDEHRGRR